MYNSKFEEQIEHGLDNSIYITTEVVTRELINYIIKMYNTKNLQFSPNVKVFSKSCFEGLFVDPIDFGSAENLEKIEESAFEDARGLNAEDCFLNVKKIGQYAFAGCEIKDSLSLPEVKSIPEGCFEGAQINVLKLQNVKSITYGALRNLHVTKLVMPSEVKSQYHLHNIDKKL